MTKSQANLCKSQAVWTKQQKKMQKRGEIRKIRKWRAAKKTSKSSGRGEWRRGKWQTAATLTKEKSGVNGGDGGASAALKSSETTRLNGRHSVAMTATVSSLRNEEPMWSPVQTYLWRTLDT